MDTRRGFSPAVLLLVVGIIALGLGMGARYFYQKNTSTGPDSESMFLVTEDQEQVPKSIVVEQLSPPPTHPVTVVPLECAEKTDVQEKAECIRWSIMNSRIEEIAGCMKLQDNLDQEACMKKFIPSQYEGLTPSEVIELKNERIKSAVNQIINTPEYNAVFYTTESFDAFPPSGTVLDGKNTGSEILNLLAQTVLDNEGGPLKFLRSTGTKDIYFVRWAKLNGSPAMYYCVDFSTNLNGVTVSNEPTKGDTKCPSN